MTRDEHLSVVPEISPAGNELPHQPQESGPASPQAEQGPAPEVVSATPLPTPSGEALSSTQVAALAGDEGGAAANQALDQAESHEDTSQS